MKRAKIIFAITLIIALGANMAEAAAQPQPKPKKDEINRFLRLMDLRLKQVGHFLGAGFAIHSYDGVTYASDPEKSPLMKAALDHMEQMDEIEARIHAMYNGDSRINRKPAFGSPVYEDSKVIPTKPTNRTAN